MRHVDIIVVGAGITGAAIAFGLAERGLKVVVLDGDRGDFRASRANFGLVWVQGKGRGFPAYQTITQASSADWADFSDRTFNASGLRLPLEQKGGLAFCVGEADWNKRKALNDDLIAQQPSNRPGTEMLDRSTLEKLLPGVRLGDDVVGASFGAMDGAVNPLELLSALHVAIKNLGGELHFQTPVTTIIPDKRSFRVQCRGQSFEAEKVVLAAGLATEALATQLDMHLPLRPQRGQVLVTERASPFLPLPASGLRQTAEGTVLIGVTNEDVGLDTSTTAEGAAKMALKATKIIPALKQLHLVRQWAGLRVLSPDGCPIYEQSVKYPGAFAATCHSGITLAAFHAGELADAIFNSQMSARLSAFSPERFNVQKSG